VQNARLTVDGAVLGAGNLTYSKLRPGRHTYTVSREGFEPVEGTFTLEAGKALALSVDLVPASAAAKRAVYDEEDFYYSAQGNIERGDYETAMEDLNQAIAKSPSYVDAYLLRARIFEGRQEVGRAHDDYIRAAEILRFQNDYSEAIGAYNKALEVNPESVGGYVGRAKLFLEQGQDIAAITDFDQALRLDDKNLTALLGLGEARYNQGAYGKAIDHFKDARSISPEDPTIHQFLMLAYLADDNIKEVNKSYEKYLKYASEQEAERLKTDPEFSAVMRVIKD
jgi:tetratricopeptide (TPR) repeat protein